MSMGEILMILFIYLLLFGAKGVPTMAKTLGKTLYQFRNAAKDVQNEILKSADEMRRNAQVPLDQVVDFPAAPAEAKTYQPAAAAAPENLDQATTVEPTVEPAKTEPLPTPENPKESTSEQA